MTDVGNAEYFIERHGENVRYCVDDRIFYCYNGRWWVRDELGRVNQKAKDTVKIMYDDLKGIADSELRKARFAWAMKSESNTRLKAMLEQASSDKRIVVRSADMDSHQHLLCAGNGIVDLRTGALLGYQRDLLITKHTPVFYEPRASSEHWRKFLFEITGGDPDYVNFLQEAVGYSIQGSTKEEVIFIGHGPGGTGKSTFHDTIASAIGEYYVAANPATFLKRDRHSSGPSEDLARLAGARFVSAVEVDDGQRLAEGLVKQITGGDIIAARFLYQGTFQFKPQLKLWFAVNHVPAVMADDDAMWRRLIRLPFVHKPKVVDKGLKSLLTSRESREAILAWAVEGCVRWHQSGLVIPRVVRDSTKALRDEMNPLGEFIEDCCMVVAGAATAVSEVTFVYDRWCQAAGQRRPLSKKSFNRNMEALDFHQSLQYIGGRRTRCWVGLKLKDGRTPIYSKPLSGLEAHFEEREDA
jgi:putative DNA primase/helicase